MTLTEQLEQYDIKSGDFVEFINGELWLVSLNPKVLISIKGTGDPFGEKTRIGFGVLGEYHEIKRVLRTNWDIERIAQRNYSGCSYESAITFAELKPKPSMRKVTIEVPVDVTHVQWEAPQREGEIGAKHVGVIFI